MGGNSGLGRNLGGEWLPGKGGHTSEHTSITGFQLLFNMGGASFSD